jgi:soluble lytic murein transglycosylase
MITRGMTDEMFEKIVNAVIAAESSGNEHAVSDKGAQGLMQLMPGTAKEVLADYGFPASCYQPFNEKQNRLLGSLYLKKMMKLFGELKLALAAYNDGPGNVSKLTQKYGDFYNLIEANLPLETRNYVTRITGRLHSEGIIV